MKLIYLSLLIFAPLCACEQFRVIKRIIKGGWDSFYPDSKGSNCAYFIDLNDFQRDDKLYFTIKIYAGNFRDVYMRYQASDIYKSENEIIDMYYSERYTSSTHSSTYIGSWFSEYTYYFTVYRPRNYRYFYFAPPPSDYRYDSRIYVYNTNSLGIPIWVWITVGAFVLVVAILSIVIYRCKRASRLNNIDTSSAEPIVALNQVDSSPVPPSPSPYVPNPTPYVPNPSPYPMQPQPVAYY